MQQAEPQPPELNEAQRLAVEMGQRIRYVREALQLTTTEFASRLNVEETTIRYIEKGRRGPSVPLIATLCHALRITPQYLFYGDVKGITPSLRAALVEAHPELQWPSLPRAAGKWNRARKTSVLRTRRRPRMELLES